MIEAKIQSRIADLEQHHGVTILYACESGSRAWGFASPDSDYDIRFIYRQPRDRYLSVAQETQTIEASIEDNLDPGGWDIRKAAGLLGRSNGALLEWLHSPIVYRSVPGFVERWRSAAKRVFSPRASIDHYRGLAKQMWLTKLQADAVRAKDYLYALRASLAMQWILQGKGIPPVPFEQVLEIAPPTILALVPDLLAHKASTPEGTLMATIPELDAFLEACLDPSLELPAAHAVDRTALDLLFRSELNWPSPSTTILTRPDFTLERVQKPDLLLLDVISGSHAYGTQIPGSDLDRKGVFAAPSDFLMGLETIEQVSDERHNEVFYELGRFVALLAKNNPNLLEMLATPEDCVRYRHPALACLKPELFLSKRCLQTFGDYALGQVRKARGLNKKIVNPQPETRKTLADFCQVLEAQGSVPLTRWLESRGFRQKDCGLSDVEHAPGIFALYHDAPGKFEGLFSPKNPDHLKVQRIPKESSPIAWLVFHQDAYRAHCKAHREYWEWVSQRNEERFMTNSSHGRGYDSKNLMHTHRLLDMAEEIATEGVIRVRRPNREHLLRIRAGDFDYETLLHQAQEKHEKIRRCFESSPLPDAPDESRIREMLLEIRHAL